MQLAWKIDRQIVEQFLGRQTEETPGTIGSWSDTADTAEGALWSSRGCDLLFIADLGKGQITTGLRAEGGT